MLPRSPRSSANGWLKCNDNAKPNDTSWWTKKARCEWNNPSWRIQLSRRSREKYVMSWHRRVVCESFWRGKVFSSSFLSLRCNIHERHRKICFSFHLPSTAASGEHLEADKEDRSDADSEISIAAEICDGAIGTWNESCPRPSRCSAGEVGSAITAKETFRDALQFVQDWREGERAEGHYTKRSDGFWRHRRCQHREDKFRRLQQLFEAELWSFVQSRIRLHAEHRLGECAKLSRHEWRLSRLGSAHA